MKSGSREAQRRRLLTKVFLQQILDMLDNNMLQLEHVLFSVECISIISVHANPQNYRYLSRDNPHWMRKEVLTWPDLNAIVWIFNGDDSL